MDKQSIKAQVAMEFVYLVGVAFMVMVVFVASTRSEFSDLRNVEERSLIKDVSMMIQNELILASNVADGYSRTFVIPSNLNGISYNISVADDLLIASSANYEYEVNLPSIIGNLTKGNNTITKINGTIRIN